MFWALFYSIKSQELIKTGGIHSIASVYVLLFYKVLKFSNTKLDIFLLEKAELSYLLISFFLILN